MYQTQMAGGNLHGAFKNQFLGPTSPQASGPEGLTPHFRQKQWHTTSAGKKLAVLYHVLFMLVGSGKGKKKFPSNM